MLIQGVTVVLFQGDEKESGAHGKCGPCANEHEKISCFQYER